MKKTQIVICIMVVLMVSSFKQRRNHTKEKGPLPGMEFVLIKKGSFIMGSKNTSNNKRNEGKFEHMLDNDKPWHQVDIKAFHMMTTELTCEQWNYVMGGEESPTPRIAKGNVTYKQVQEFLKKLNAIDPGKNYRLPTEAEWEYACWAGSQNDGVSVMSDDQLDQVAWIQTNSNRKIHQVALKEPNAWGLHDMIGNVYELCEDEYHESYHGAPEDGSAWITSSGPEKGVVRGGDCFLELFRCNPYARDWMFRNKNPHFTVGFRLVRD